MDGWMDGSLEDISSAFNTLLYLAAAFLGHQCLALGSAT